ncbi:PTS system, mannitol-specific transporter subunit IICB [[Mycoplasma] cavipharyngis]|uniref:PTS transporter subunit EIIC n=1 Tax=[Mycoplasma] cavipharyngis TaxID=92757 RepID=UPI003704743F
MSSSTQIKAQRFKLTLSKIKLKIQSLGTLLSSMILPIIGIFIAWGLLTSFFVDKGWAPNKLLASMVGIGITYVIPIIIAFLGGKKIYDMRGGAIAALVSIAAVAAGQSTTFVSITSGAAPMILATMIFGPLSALILKHTEKFWIHKIKPGFEMLVNNFYLGFLGFGLLFPVFYTSIYGIGYLQVGLKTIVEAMQQYKLYPLAAIFIEPAKVLFLNNAINHGVFTPLGIAEVSSNGKSILFLLESNPGPGLGILLAFSILMRKKNKNLSSQALSSVPIHLFGGIHEVYFPFVLLRPILILAAIGGGVIGDSVLQIFNVGANAPVSPGSIIAGYIQINKTANDVIGYTLAIVLSAITSALLSWFILFFNDIIKKIKNKNHRSDLSNVVELPKVQKLSTTQKINLNLITFACDAGMGSSVMGATIFRKLLKDNAVKKINVVNQSIANLTNEKFVVTITALADRVRAKVPDAQVYTVDQFLNKNAYLEIIKIIKNESI